MIFSKIKSYMVVLCSISYLFGNSFSELDTGSLTEVAVA